MLCSPSSGFGVGEDDTKRMRFDYDIRNIQDGWGWVKKCVPWHCRYMERSPVIKFNQIITDTIWIYSVYRIIKLGVKL